MTLCGVTDGSEDNTTQVIILNECTKVQNPRRPHVRESLKAHELDLYNVRTRMLERHMRLKLKVLSLYTAGSFDQRAVRMLVTSNRNT